MTDDIMSTFLAIVSAIVVLVGVYMLITTFITGATRTIDMIGYTTGAVAILLGIVQFVNYYERLE